MIEISENYNFEIDDKTIETPFEETKIQLFEYITKPFGDFAELYGERVKDSDEDWPGWPLKAYKEALEFRNAIKLKDPPLITHKNKVVKASYIRHNYPIFSGTFEAGGACSESFVCAQMDNDLAVILSWNKRLEFLENQQDAVLKLNEYNLTFLNKNMKKMLNAEIQKYIKQNEREIAKNFLKNNGNLFEFSTTYYKILGVLEGTFKFKEKDAFL